MDIFVDLFPAHRTCVIPCFDPVLDALRVEEVFFVAFQLCHVILHRVCVPADDALIVTGGGESTTEFSLLQTLEDEDRSMLLLVLVLAPDYADEGDNDDDEDIQEDMEVTNYQDRQHEVRQERDLCVAGVVGAVVESISIEEPRNMG